VKLVSQKSDLVVVTMKRISSLEDETAFVHHVTILLTAEVFLPHILDIKINLLRRVKVFMTVKRIIFWYVTPCDLLEVKVYRTTRGYLSQ
jgi:hypothetical protein